MRLSRTGNLQEMWLAMMACLIGLSAGQVWAVDYVYFTVTDFEQGNPQGIYRTAIGGENVGREPVLVGNVRTPWDITIDQKSKRMFWSDSREGTLKSAKIDGTDVKVLAARMPEIFSVDIDHKNGRIYWATCGQGKSRAMYSMKLDGSDPKRITGMEQECFAGVAIDEDSDTLFWTAFGNNLPRLRKSNLDGSDEQDIFYIDVTTRDIDLDEKHKKIYWVDTESSIRRADYDGTNDEAFYAEPNEDKPDDEHEEVWSLVVDSDNGYVYFSRPAHGGSILRKRISGGGLHDAEVVLQNAGGAPFGIALYSDKSVNAGPDSDGDGVPDKLDNCPRAANKDQADLDFDRTGDACDDDMDGDGVNNGKDNCPRVANGKQRDLDGDGTGDKCDDDIDGDGVTNDKDVCNDTPRGTRIGTNGTYIADLDADCDVDLDDQKIMQGQFTGPKGGTAAGTASAEEAAAGKE